MKCGKLEALGVLWSLRREHYELSINTHPQSRGQKNSIRQNHQRTLKPNIAIVGLQWRCLSCYLFHFYPCGCRPVSRFLFADRSGLCPPISLIALASHTLNIQRSTSKESAN
jgi:hypothetical protein